MDWKNFLLFESTGDSEEVCDLNNSSDDNMEVSYDDVDDCQSCCSDSSDICNDNDQFQECSYSKRIDLERTHGHVYKSTYRYQNDCDEDEDDDDGAVSQECSSRNAGFGYSRTQKKSKVYVDSRMEPMKKEEKDKLFWDTCLAS